MTFIAIFSHYICHRFSCPQGECHFFICFLILLVFSQIANYCPRLLPLFLAFSDLVFLVYLIYSLDKASPFSHLYWLSSTFGYQIWLYLILLSWGLWFTLHLSSYIYKRLSYLPVDCIEGDFCLFLILHSFTFSSLWVFFIFYPFLEHSSNNFLLFINELDVNVLLGLCQKKGTPLPSFCSQYQLSVPYCPMLSTHYMVIHGSMLHTVGSLESPV